MKILHAYVKGELKGALTGYDITKNNVVCPIKDLIPLCSNNYSVAHRKSLPYTIEEIKSMNAN